MKTILSRRKFLLASSSSVLALAYTPAQAQNFLNSLRNFIVSNYDRSLRDLTNDAVKALIRKVMPIADDLQTATSGLQQHFFEEWDNAISTNGNLHTQKCPYCIAVAKEVERRAPELDQIPNKTPNCFLINGAPYVSSSWGSLHSYQNGVIGPAQGAIWFANGKYIARAHNGRSYIATPAC